MTGAATAERDEARREPTGLKARLGSSPEDVAWLAVVAGGLLLTAAIAWLAPALDALYPTPSGDLFPEWDVVIMPEPLEQVRAILALATPFALAAAVLLLGVQRPSRRSLDYPILAVQLILGGLLVWAVLEQSRLSGFLPEDYFEPLLLSVPVLVAGAVIGVVLTIAAIRSGGRETEPRTTSSPAPMRQWGFAFALAALATVIFLLPAVATDGTAGGSGPLASGHIPTQGEDYFAVANGRTPLVDYISQYANLLPYAVEPILRAFDSSVTSFSIAMCVLSGLGLLAVFGVFSEVTRRPWPAIALFVPWVALSLFPWDDMGAIREFNGNYYGVLPGRYLGPFVLAWLTARSIRRPIPAWALFGFAGLVALNNWEFGAAALIALVVAQLAALDQFAPSWGSIRSLALQAAAGLLAAIAFVCALTLIRAGELPDPSLLTYFSRVFLREGYGLIPMPSGGLHWAIYATYVAALLVAAVRFVRRDPDRVTTVMLAFSSTFGLATALYFAGRSSQFQLILLFPAWGLALALLAHTAHTSLRSAGGERLRLRRTVVPAGAALIGFGVMVACIAKLSTPWSQIDRLSGDDQPLEVQGPVDYLRAETSPGEHVVIIGATADHLVADRAGVVNVSPINGPTALFSPAEVDRALDQLEEEGGTQVFDRVAALPEFARILRARGYEVVGIDTRDELRHWRRQAG